MNVRDETRHDIHKSAALRCALLCIVTRLISDIHFHITGPKLTFNSSNNVESTLNWIYDVGVRCFNVETTLHFWRCIYNVVSTLFQRRIHTYSYMSIYQQEAQRATYRAPEYNVPPFWGIGQRGHFCLLIGPKNINSEEDVEILLPVKLRWIPFSGFRGEVENVSANQRPGRPSCFSDWPEKHKLGRGLWDLASCKVSLNSVQRFKKRSWKCLSQS